MAAFLLLVAAACGTGVPLGAADAPAVVAPAPSSSPFDVSYVVRVNPPLGSRKVRVWMPLPSTDPFQTISELHITSPVPVQIHTERQFNNRYAYADVDSARVRTGFELRVTFHVVRYERPVYISSSKVLPGPPPKEIAPFLQSDSVNLADGASANLARQLTEGLSDPVEKARRIYDYLISNVRRNPLPAGAERRGAAGALQSGQGNCEDFHSLFIAMARAAGIPARVEIGFSLPEEQKQGTIAGYQSWAEFYVNGLGWIPVDAWGGSQQSGGDQPFFGFLDAHRVMISVGRDIAFTAAPQAARLGYFAYPYMEADGQSSPVSSMEFFFNAVGLESPPRIFRKSIFAFAGFAERRAAS